MTRTQRKGGKLVNEPTAKGGEEEREGDRDTD